jgi:hypothetical protein
MNIDIEILLLSLNNMNEIEKVIIKVESSQTNVIVANCNLGVV